MQRLECFTRMVELELALGKARNGADVVGVELQDALAIFGTLGVSALDEERDGTLVIGLGELRGCA